MDANGNLVAECMDFVPMYKKLLECSTSGKVKQHLDLGNFSGQTQTILTHSACWQCSTLLHL